VFACLSPNKVLSIAMMTVVIALVLWTLRCSGKTDASRAQLSIGVSYLYMVRDIEAESKLVGC
jgi:hypothetical protein